MSSKLLATKLLILIWLFMLASCTSLMPTATDIAIRPTETPTVDFESLRGQFEQSLVQTGDFTDNFTGQTIFDIPPLDPQYPYEILPTADLIVRQEIRNEYTKKTGDVIIFLYQETQSRDNAFGTVKWSNNSVDIGEKGAWTSAKFWTDNWTEIVFTRCHAFVFISIHGLSGELTANYARRLDRRIGPLVCQ